MKSLYLHIGWPKTGTTALQKFCRENPDVLGAHGLAYYASRGDCSGSVARAMAKGEAMDKHRTRFLDWVDRQDALRILISSEGFASCDLTALSAFLDAERWRSITVIAYLRPQDAFLEGWYKQIVKWGGKIDLRTYLSDRNPVWRQADYDQHLARWQAWCAALPDARIMPAIYEREALTGGNIGADFFARLGFPGLRPQIAGNNVSPSRALIGLYLQLPEIDRLQQINRAMVGSGHPAATGSGDLLTDTQRAAIAARFAAGNERIRARYFPERPVLFAERPASPPAAEDATLTPLLIATLDQMRGPEIAALARAALV